MNLSNNEIYNAAFADELIKIADVGSHSAAFQFLKEAGVALGWKNWLRHPAISAQAKYHSGLGKFFNWISGSAASTKGMRASAAGKSLLHEQKGVGKVKELKDIGAFKAQNKASLHADKMKADQIAQFKGVKSNKSKYAPEIKRKEQGAIDARIREGLRTKDRTKIKKQQSKLDDLKDLEKKRKSKNMFAHLGRPIVGTTASEGTSTAAGLAMVGVPSYIAGKYMISSTQRPTERYKFGAYQINNPVETESTESPSELETFIDSQNTGV
jgi:hypothetical protein